MEEEQQPKETPEQNAGPTPPPIVSRPRARKKPFQWKSMSTNGLFVLFGLIVIVLVYSFIDRMFIDPPVNVETNSGGKTHIIQLDVRAVAGQIDLVGVGAEPGQAGLAVPVQRAKHLHAGMVDDLLGDFPFVSDADKAGIIVSDEQVNSAIKKHLDSEKVVTVLAGTLPDAAKVGTLPQAAKTP